MRLGYTHVMPLEVLAAILLGYTLCHSMEDKLVLLVPPVDGTALQLEMLVVFVLRHSPTVSAETTLDSAVVVNLSARA